MGVKADEMKELMDHIGGPKAKPSLSEAEQEARKPLPPHILIDAKQDRIHVEKTVRKRIVFKKVE
jgi:hypothetical protein